MSTTFRSLLVTVAALGAIQQVTAAPTGSITATGPHVNGYPGNTFNVNGDVINVQPQASVSRAGTDPQTHFIMTTVFLNGGTTLTETSDQEILTVEDTAGSLSDYLAYTIPNPYSNMYEAIITVTYVDYNNPSIEHTLDSDYELFTTD